MNLGGLLNAAKARGNGSYTGKLGILDCDAHTQVDRFGSANEAWD